MFITFYTFKVVFRLDSLTKTHSLPEAYAPGSGLVLCGGEYSRPVVAITWDRSQISACPTIDQQLRTRLVAARQKGPAMIVRACVAHTREALPKQRHSKVLQE
jgi:hypothetical protein